MSDSEVESDTSSGVKIPRFHGKRGEDYTLWRHRLRAACRIKGLWNVVTSGSEQSSIAATTQDTAPSSSQSSSRLLGKREKACAIIICALGDAPLRVVMDVDDNPARMLELLDARYASNRTVSRIAVQTQLFRLSYNGQNMSEYVDQFAALFSQLDRMGKDAAIPESHKAPMLLASIDPNCSLESTAAALRTKEITELTWDYVATTLIDEYNARQMTSAGSGRSRSRKKGKNKTSGSSKSSANTATADHKDGNFSDDHTRNESTGRAYAASSSNGYHCTFCDRDGHTSDRCHMNPDNPDNHLPKSILDKLNVTSRNKSGSSKTSGKSSGKSSKIEIAGMSLEKSTVLPPSLGNMDTYADSGATSHFFCSESVFVPSSLHDVDGRKILLADNTTVTATQRGDVILPFTNANLRLTDALYVPDLEYNLVSVGRMADRGIESFFRVGDVCLTHEDGFVIGCGQRDKRSGLYTLPEPVIHDSRHALSARDNDLAQLWHRRLAHINPRDLQVVHKHVDGVPKLSRMEEICRPCRLGKAHKLPFPGKFERAAVVGDVVHSDILGPLLPSFPDRYRYASAFIDEHSRYALVGFMVHRSELAEVYTAVAQKLQQLGGAQIAKVHSDNAEEYIALQDNPAHDLQGTSFSPPYTPEHNAIAERINRTMEEAARALLLQANLPECLWPYALKHVIHVRNRVPHSATGLTPHVLVTERKPSLKNVRVFGCAAYVLKMNPDTKFESRALEGVYLQTLEHGVYDVLVTDEHEVPRIVKSRHVTFDESVFPGAPYLENYWDDESAGDGNFSCDTDSFTKSESSAFAIDDVEDDSVPIEAESSHTPDSVIATSSEDEDAIVDELAPSEDDIVTLEEHNTQSVSEPEQRYPRRTRREPKRWWYMANAATSDQIEVTTSDEPTLTEALSASPTEKSLWEAAIQDELHSLDAKGTWIVDDSPASQPLPTHVVLKVKRNADGSVDRFKARVVAGGNRQTFGQDYMETYAPVVSFSVVRLFLYLTLCMQMYVAQVDVKTAFLNGELKEDVWVTSPRGVSGLKPCCYKLVKAMYGLKQAHLAWHTKLSKDLRDLGFEELPSAPCVFRRKFGDIGYSYILVYVDDLLVFTPNAAQRSSILEELRELYELRFEDRVSLYLGVQLTWTTDSDGSLVGLKLGQRLYIEGMLRRFGLCNCKPARSPMVESFFTSLATEEDKSSQDVQLFQQMIGSLLYLALRTRLDILAPVLILARFQNAPTAYCHRAVKRVLRYLRGTCDLGLLYQPGSLQLSGFVDSDFAGDTTDRKSMSGYLVKLGSATCMFGARKQASVALSTAEAEYYALTLAAQEIMWIVRVLREGGFDVEEPVPIRSDNQCAIEWATGERCPSGRAKHIDVKVHFIRNLVKHNVLRVDYVPSELNDSDILTKPLPPASAIAIMERIGLGQGPEEEC